MNIGPLLVFVAAVLWGIDGVLRRTLYDLPPTTIVFYEHLIGLVLISPFLLKAWKKEVLTKKEWGVIFLVALLSGVLGTLFFTSALLAVSFIPFSVVFLIQKLQPVFTVATAAVVLKERVSMKYVLLAGIALIAGYFVTFPGGVVNLSDGGGHLMAAGLALLAAISWGSSTAFSRSLLLKHDNTFVTGLRFLITVPIALVFVGALGAAPSLTAVTLSQLGVLALIAVSTGMLALWIYYRGLRSTPASTATIVELAFPLTAIAIDYFLYGTALTGGQYLAAVVLLASMYAVARLPLVSAPQT
ncbi:DMT family transporter [Patescibacteria group bacterium]|nr:DMT family transporter [Patescibacteria group bacterium]